MRIFTRLAAFILPGIFLFLPLLAFAEVIPLAPLPTNFGNDTETLGGYVNTIFQLAIAAGAALAVIQVVIGGLKYMTTEAVTGTKDARTIITGAIVGLLVLLGSWLILFVINPDLTNLKALNFDPLPNATGIDRELEQQRGTVQKESAAQQGDVGVFNGLEADTDQAPYRQAFIERCTNERKGVVQTTYYCNKTQVDPNKVGFCFLPNTKMVCTVPK